MNPKQTKRRDTKDIYTDEKNTITSWEDSYLQAKERG
jgi:hypothetical protein